MTEKLLIRMEPIAQKRSDRREHLRVACDIIDTKGQVIKNLGLGGACIVSRLSYSPSEKIPLNFHLPSGRRKLSLHARVVRGDSQEGSRKVGYGISFEDLESEDLKDLGYFLRSQTSSVARDLQLVKGERFRPTRYGPDFLRGLKAQCYATVSKERIEGQVHNFSKFGASAIFNANVKWVPGDTVHDLQLILEDRELFRGSVIVRYYRKVEGAYQYGFEFCDSYLDLQYAYALQEFSKILSSFGNTQAKLVTLKQIKPDFKIIVADFYYLLETLKRKLEQDETRINRIADHEKKRVVEKDCLEFVDMQFRRKVHDYIAILDGLFKELSPEEQLIYLQYCRDMLLPHFHAASFIARAFFKPLGYPGDYEMMNMIYDQPYSGDSLWQKAANRLFWTVPANQAVRNRARYLSDKIRDIVSQNKREPKNIMSLACGPCKEIQMLMADPLDPLSQSAASFHLVDQDPHALSYLSDVLGELNLKRRKKVGFNYYGDNVGNFIKDPDVRKKFPPQDLIYAAGLFDYLNDEIAELLIGIFYFMLKPGGTMIVGNFSPNNPTRLAQEFGLDWFLIYRNEEELKKLVPKFLKKCGEVVVEGEPTHINLFLNVKKSYNAQIGE